METNCSLFPRIGKIFKTFIANKNYACFYIRFINANGIFKIQFIPGSFHHTFFISNFQNKNDRKTNKKTKLVLWIKHALKWYGLLKEMMRYMGWMGSSTIWTPGCCHLSAIHTNNNIKNIITNITSGPVNRKEKNKFQGNDNHHQLIESTSVYTNK